MTVKNWTSVAGAWLGVGTSPGALLLGAGIAARHQGAVPLLSVILGFGLMFALIWFQGHLGLVPPHGDGGNLTDLAPRYFDSRMQRLLGALIAMGMIGWFGFNVGLGGAAFGALLQVPAWSTTLVLGLPIAFLSLRGMHGWNKLAALTTISVMILIVLVVTQLGARSSPVTWATDSASFVITDMAVIVGFVAVFIVRAPDFTAGLRVQRDLVIVGLLICLSMLGVILAGVNLGQGTGSSDIVNLLARPGGLAIGNLLITLAVIAPTFTTFYSGVPGLRAATGIDERAAQWTMAIVGMFLALLRFDLWLLPWLGILAALLPPVIVPFAIESHLRRTGRAARIVPMWVWMAGAAGSLVLTLAQNPLALLVGLGVSLLATFAWRWKND